MELARSGYQHTVLNDFTSILFRIADSENADVDALPSRTVYRSCKRTVEDEEFLLVRFQVFCFLTGTIAFMSVRKQKAAAASLFDQRKLNLQKRRSDAMTNGGMEMTATSTTRQEETKALMSSDQDGLDIV
jgi:hypothetical protein